MSDNANPFGLPWQAPDVLSGGGAIIDVTGREVCLVWAQGFDNYEQRRDFIVEAVNAHHGLLDQTEKLRARVEGLEASRADLLDKIECLETRDDDVAERLREM